MGVRVALYTGLLCLLVTVSATGIIALVFQAWGIRTAGLREVMISCAIMCLILSPIVLGPLVWMTFRYRCLSARLRSVALTDPLTRVPNRRAFFEHASERIGHAGQPRRFSLLMIDVDRFKELNDRLGHDAGDAALVHIAGELARSLAEAGAPDALLARLGGEEFTVFLGSAGAGVAEAVAESLCSGLRASTFMYQGRRVPLSISIGVWSGTAAEVDGPLARADAAVYAAKARGRDCWQVADGSDGTRVPATTSPHLPQARAPVLQPDGA